MHLTQEQSNSVEQCAYRLIPPSLIAVNIEVDEFDFMTDLRIPGTDVFRSFYRGYVSQLIECREAIIKTAKKFQFHKVQLKVLSRYQEKKTAVFQFHKVQLKVTIRP